MTTPRVAETSARVAQILAELRAKGSPENVAGMARYGIATTDTLGVSVYELRRMARQAGQDHQLAEQLWASGVHEARLLAVFVDDAASVTAVQMERWAADFDSWDVCDQACTSLFDSSSLAWEKAIEWADRKEEFVKRGGFALMAGLAVHDKTAADERFLELLPVLERQADDDRNYVRKAVNWALRNIGKRNARLHAAAIETAQAIAERGTRSARWIAADALRELRSEKVLRRLHIEGRPNDC
jgi:3-methyladenine DNA glycosylase AlkD